MVNAGIKVGGATTTTTMTNNTPTNPITTTPSIQSAATQTVMVPCGVSVIRDRQMHEWVQDGITSVSSSSQEKHTSHITAHRRQHTSRGTLSDSVAWYFKTLQELLTAMCENMNSVSSDGMLFLNYSFTHQIPEFNQFPLIFNILLLAIINVLMNWKYSNGPTTQKA